MSKARILVVEDEVIIALQLEEKLKSLGYEITSTVNNGDETFKKAEEDNPDLILMDIRIQGEKDGIEIAEIIRSKFGIPVVFSTAYLDEERIERAKITMPFGYVLKPIQERDLRVTIEMALYVAKVDAERSAVEEKLKESEKLFRSIIEDTPVLICQFLPGGEIKFVNQSYCDYFKKTSEELIGKSFLTLIPKEDKESVWETISALNSENSVMTHDHKVILPNGSVAWQRWTNRAILDSDNKIVSYQSIGEDITKQKLTEEALKKSESRLKEAQAVAHIGYWELDSPSGTPAWSDEIYRIFGLDTETDAPSFSEHQNIVHHEDWPRLEKSIAILNEDGTPFSIQFRIHRSNGEIGWMHSKGTAEIDGTGTVIRMFGTAQDITEFKQAEKQLNQIEWLLSKQSKTKAGSLEYGPDYGDLAQLNTCRVLLDNIGEELLSEIANDYLELLDSSAAIYEKNGDYALGIFSSGWCRYLNQASRNLCNTDYNLDALNSGKWLCHESCWSDASKTAIETGKPNNIECNGGIRIFAVPVRAGDEIVGAVNFGYGNPPDKHDQLLEIAKKYQVDVDKLTELANAYDARPNYIIELAKKRLITSAKLIGKLIEKSDN